MDLPATPREQGIAQRLTLRTEGDGARAGAVRGLEPQPQMRRAHGRDIGEDVPGQREQRLGIALAEGPARAIAAASSGVRAPADSAASTTSPLLARARPMSAPRRSSRKARSASSAPARA